MTVTTATMWPYGGRQRASGISAEARILPSISFCGARTAMSQSRAITTATGVTTHRFIVTGSGGRYARRKASGRSVTGGSRPIFQYPESMFLNAKELGEAAE